jgi:FkbM family methyltransferase
VHESRRSSNDELHTNTTVKFKCSLRKVGGRKKDSYGAWTLCDSQQLNASKHATSAADRALIYSFGLGEDTSFDEAIIEQYGAVVHGFDPTPKSLVYVQKRAAFLPECFFALHDFGLNDKDGEIKLYPPANPTHVSHSQVPRDGATPIAATVLRLATVLRVLGHRRVHVLKMDIEGAEFAVLESLLGIADSDSGGDGGEGRADGELPFDQLLVEFHPNSYSRGASAAKDAMVRIEAALGRRGFRLVHRTPSLELSFARLAGPETAQTEEPHSNYVLQ